VRFVPVESSNVAAVAYDGADVLLVKFRGGAGAGDVYRYRGVDRATYDALLAAESKGSFIARRVARNPAYQCDKMPAADVAGLVEE
jgi:KTSC domain-containing protein